MLAINYDAVPLVSAWFIGFLSGSLITIRLLGITFNASQKLLQRKWKPPLDHSGSTGLPSEQTTEAPSTDQQEHP